MGSDNQVFIEKYGKRFLPKPFTADELKAKVRETLGYIENG